MFGNSNFISSAVNDRREREIEIDEPSCSTSGVRYETSAFTTQLNVIYENSWLFWEVLLGLLNPLLHKVEKM